MRKTFPKRIYEYYNGDNLQEVFEMYEKEIASKEDKYSSILYFLSQSNNNISESNKNISYSNKFLSETNKNIFNSIELKREENEKNEQKLRSNF